MKKGMRVLMFGWEFPPLSSGGLGTACYGLTRAMSRLGIGITLVLPKAAKNAADFVKIIPANITNVKQSFVNSLLTPYMTSLEYKYEISRVNERQAVPMYGKDLFNEVERYAKKAGMIALSEQHDVIHAHDWMTFPAALSAKKASKKPLVVHIHSTEFDRTGGHGANQHVYDKELEGMQKADAVVAVSEFTKEMILRHYELPSDKIYVVHNAIDRAPMPKKVRNKHKTVLYLGRITLQKGPEYFLYTAKRVLEQCPDTTFIMAGSGDMERAMIEKAADLGISDKLLFAGFLKDERVQSAYNKADLYIMPSVSEPFGLTALEAMSQNTPVIISKQSGVSEIINHCLKADFWDIDRMADMVISVLQYPELYGALQENAAEEVSKISWKETAKKCVEIYAKVRNG